MRHYFNTVEDASTGKPIAGAVVHVLDAPGGDLVTIYESDETTEKSNPITTDGGGFFDFYCNDGNYCLEFYVGGALVRSLADVEISDSYSDALAAAESAARALVSEQNAANYALIAEEAATVGIPGGNVMAVGPFVSLDGADIDAGTTLVQSSGYYSGGPNGAGLYAYDSTIDGAFVAAHPEWSFLSNDSRGWRLIPSHGAFDLHQFGAKGDDTTNDFSSWEAALDCCRWYKNTPEDDAYYMALPRLIIPVGRFYMGTNTLSLDDGNIWIQGLGNADHGTGSGPSAFRFDANTRGMNIETFNTSNDTTHGSPYRSAMGSIVEGVTFRGGGGTNGDSHGVCIRAPSTIRYCTFTNFAGDAVRVIGTGGAGGSDEGGPNLSSVEYCNMRFNGRWGIRVSGADANVCKFIGNNAKHNGRGAWKDESFLGNTWIANHSSGNGIGGSTVGVDGNKNGAFTSFVTYPSGTGWFATPDGDLTIAPGSVGSGWEQYPGVSLPTSAEYPLWNSTDAAAGKYFVGGSFVSTNPNQRTVVIGNYTEEGESPAIVQSPSIILGGINRVARCSTAPFLTGNSSYGLWSQVPYTARSVGLVGGVEKALQATLGSSYDARWFTNFVHEVDAPQGWQHRIGTTSKDLELVYQNTDANLAFGVTGPSTSKAFGRSSPVLHALYADRLFTGSNGRQIAHASAAPTSGAWGRGDVVFNDTPSAGGKVGWVCVTAGSPGTWKAFGAIDV